MESFLTLVESVVMKIEERATDYTGLVAASDYSVTLSYQGRETKPHVVTLPLAAGQPTREYVLRLWLRATYGVDGISFDDRASAECAPGDEQTEQNYWEYRALLGELRDMLAADYERYLAAALQHSTLGEVPEVEWGDVLDALNPEREAGLEWDAGADVAPIRQAPIRRLGQNFWVTRDLAQPFPGDEGIYFSELQLADQTPPRMCPNQHWAHFKPTVGTHVCQQCGMLYVGSRDEWIKRA